MISFLPMDEPVKQPSLEERTHNTECNLTNFSINVLKRLDDHEKAIKTTAKEGTDILKDHALQLQILHWGNLISLLLWFLWLTMPLWAADPCDHVKSCLVTTNSSPSNNSIEL